MKEVDTLIAKLSDTIAQNLSDWDAGITVEMIKALAELIIATNS